MLDFLKKVLALLREWWYIVYPHGTEKRIEEVSDLPNIKSASKRDQLSKLQNEANKAKKSRMKTEIKKFEQKAEAGDKTAAKEAYVVAVKTVDQAVADHLIHKNNAARKKSRLTKKLNAIG